MGGKELDFVSAITVDNIGNVYITGTFGDTVDFNPDPSATDTLISAGGNDIFIQKLDPNGDFLWVNSIGGPNSNFYGNGITLDNFGNVYVTGRTFGSVYFTSSLGRDTLPALLGKGYILKLDTNGSFIFFNRMGLASHHENFSIATDAFGNVYTKGKSI